MVRTLISVPGWVMNGIKLIGNNPSTDNIFIRILRPIIQKKIPVLIKAGMPMQVYILNLGRIL